MVAGIQDIEIRPLQQLNSADFQLIASGYISDCKYEVMYSETRDHVSIDLQLVRLDEPYHKFWEYDDKTLQRYNQLLSKNYSFGAYESGVLVGMALAEPREWNRSMWVWEFHVGEAHRGLGIGKQLMTCVAKKAKADGFRTIVCETQNTNATAIQIYHRLGFRAEGVDISYYSNQDYPDGEVAIFMKCRL